MEQFEEEQVQMGVDIWSSISKMSVKHTNSIYLVEEIRNICKQINT